MLYTRKGLQVLCMVVEGESSLDKKSVSAYREGGLKSRTSLFFNGWMKLILFFIVF